jgi:hypothetical protein
MPKGCDDAGSSPRTRITGSATPVVSNVSRSNAIGRHQLDPRHLLLRLLRRVRREPSRRLPGPRPRGVRLGDRDGLASESGSRPGHRPGPLPGVGAARARRPGPRRGGCADDERARHPAQDGPRLLRPGDPPDRPRPRPHGGVPGGAAARARGARGARGGHPRGARRCRPRRRRLPRRDRGARRRGLLDPLARLGQPRARRQVDPALGDRRAAASGGSPASPAASSVRSA